MADTAGPVPRLTPQTVRISCSWSAVICHRVQAEAGLGSQEGPQRQSSPGPETGNPEMLGAGEGTGDSGCVTGEASGASGVRLEPSQHGMGVPEGVRPSFQNLQQPVSAKRD